METTIGQCAASMTWAEFGQALPDHAWWMGAVGFAVLISAAIFVWRIEHVHLDCPDAEQQRLDDNRDIATLGLLLAGVFGWPLVLLLNLGGKQTLGLLCQVLT